MGHPASVHVGPWEVPQARLSLNRVLPLQPYIDQPEIAPLSVLPRFDRNQVLIAARTALKLDHLA